MAYDIELADRVRDEVAAALGGSGPVEEKRMFGGLAFLVGGNMAVAVSGQGGLLVRADPDETDALLDRPHTSLMVMSGRPTKGWLRVEEAGVATPAQLAEWVDVGVTRAGSLPAK